MTDYELTPPVRLITEGFTGIPSKKLALKSNDSASERKLKMGAYYNNYNFHTWEDVNGDNFTALQL